MFKNAGRVKRTIEEYFVLTVATLILEARSHRSVPAPAVR